MAVTESREEAQELVGKRFFVEMSVRGKRQLVEHEVVSLNSLNAIVYRLDTGVETTWPVTLIRDWMKKNADLRV